MDVEKIAELAKIKLSDEEKETLTRDFEKIINWVGELSSINTENCQPFIFEYATKLRDDTPIDFKNKDAIIKNFPEREFDFVKVKKVID